MWHMGDGWGWWMGFGLIWMIILMAVMGSWRIGFGWIWMIVPMAVIAWAMLRHTERARARHEPRGLVEPSSQEILEQRYAAGEPLSNVMTGLY